MVKIKEFINRIKFFFSSNPKRVKLLGIIFVLAVLPLTVVAALTIQNLTQKASVSGVLTIADSSGNPITSTTDPNIFIDINLSTSTQWTLPAKPSTYNGLIKKTYALTCIDNCLNDGVSTYAECQAQCTPVPTATPVPPTPTPIPPTATSATIPTATPIPVPTATSATKTPTCPAAGTIITAGIDCASDYLIRNKVADDNCGETIKSNYCGSGEKCVLNAAGSGASCIKYAAPPTPTPQRNFGGGFFGGGVGGSNSQPTPTPTPNILRAISIENKDVNGTGGSLPIKIVVKSGADIAHIPWKLNELNASQTQASRTVQVTLISDAISIPFLTTVNLTKPTSNVPVSPTISLPDRTISTQSGNVPSPNIVLKSFDLNKDGVVDSKDVEILIKKINQKGNNLPEDLNNDGIIDSVDYNILLKEVASQSAQSNPSIRLTTPTVTTNPVNPAQSPTQPNPNSPNR